MAGKLEKVKNIFQLTKMSLARVFLTDFSQCVALVSCVAEVHLETGEKHCVLTGIGKSYDIDASIVG